MYIDTAELIDATIEQLRTLQGVFAEDFHLCRRTGLSQDARRCGEALEAISLLLPRLQLARATQDPAAGRYGGANCPNCD
jgi:hypothetical protein